jgi:hypothetical protein
MKQYIGVKMIQAKPMNRKEYNDYRGWELPSDENGADDGYLVEYLDGGQSNHPNHKGYISWSPADVFEKAYKEITGLTFGLAIEALKQGKRVSRWGWNGISMFLFLLPAGTVPTKAIHDPALRQVIESEIGGETFEALGSIRMFTADKKILTGWLASQTDILAEDWVILD